MYASTVPSKLSSLLPFVSPLQIESLQCHLESLKAEKHRLFQQLKMVLHEEDEKRIKDLEQKQLSACTSITRHMIIM